MIEPTKKDQAPTAMSSTFGWMCVVISASIFSGVLWFGLDALHSERSELEEMKRVAYSAYATVIDSVGPGSGVVLRNDDNSLELPGLAIVDSEGRRRICLGDLGTPGFGLGIYDESGHLIACFGERGGGSIFEVQSPRVGSQIALSANPKGAEMMLRSGKGAAAVTRLKAFGGEFNHSALLTLTGERGGVNISAGSHSSGTIQIVDSAGDEIRSIK